MDAQLILGRYRPLELLGEGGFGSVVLAWDTRMQRRVAIKRLELPARSDGQPLGLDEARTSALLNHPSIVTVFDFDTDEDEAFLIMEHIDGATLTELMNTAGESLTGDETAAVVSAVAGALEFAHENGVLHLDIKPDNILIARDGRVKVADFGVAALSSLTGHGPALGGTPGYMPPEQASGDRVDERTDVFALAAVTYEAITGREPFAYGPIVRRPSDVVHDLPLAYDDVLLDALSDDPDDRHRSAQEFASDILPLLGDPKAGRSSLAELVAEHTEAPAEENLDFSELGLWDQLGGRLGSGLLRATGVVESVYLAYLGLSELTLERLPLIAAITLVAVAGAMAPSLGIVLGLVCVVAGLMALQAYATCVLVGILGLLWWWNVARRHPGAAVLPLAAPALGVAWIPFAQPLLAGFTLPRWRAAATGLLGGVLTMVASAASGHGAPFVGVWAPVASDLGRMSLAVSSMRDLIASPAAYMALLGWPLAAWLMSVACSRATRAGAFAGLAGGLAILASTYLLAGRIDAYLGATHVWMGRSLGMAVIGSLILLLIVIAAGAPLAMEDDDRADD